jgi:hypothetical protein
VSIEFPQILEGYKCCFRRLLENTRPDLSSQPVGEVLREENPEGHPARQNVSADTPLFSASECPSPSVDPIRTFAKTAAD